ncbi:hypothetical protein Trydic_g4956 [Trypoxylus dichotomus]
MGEAESDLELSILRRKVLSGPVLRCSIRSPRLRLVTNAKIRAKSKEVVRKMLKTSLRIDMNLYAPSMSTEDFQLYNGKLNLEN